MKPDPWKEILRLMRQYNLSYMLNAGGAEFSHPQRGRLQVPAQDDREDCELLKAWLAETNDDKPGSVL